MLNILGRITDANPSTIFGTIDSASFYPNANLFLMNPYGFLFGPGAMVNVGGMVAFTTADYLRLTNDVRFEAIPGGQDVLLSAFPVSAFGFLGANPAAIACKAVTSPWRTEQASRSSAGTRGSPIRSGHGRYCLRAGWRDDDWGNPLGSERSNQHC